MENTHVVILSPLRKSSGNFTTAHRIGDYFNGNGFAVSFRDPRDFHSEEEFTQFTCDSKVNVVIALHAYHTSAILKECSLPIIIVFGGTDLNEFSKNPHHYEAMSTLISKARYLVAFSQAMAKPALELWPTYQDKLRVIPQGVVTESSSYDLEGQLRQHISNQNNNKGSSTDDLLIFTLVAGIRPVKDPIYLLNTFSDWHESSRPNAFLVIIGPVIDKNYANQLLKHVERSSGVVYLGTLGQAETHAAIKSSTALVNSSLSEGNSMALLEALAIGTPIIARDIPGNRGLITHGHNGLLYDSPEDFIKKAELLLSEDGMRERLVKNGITSVARQNSSETEKAAYRNFVTSLLKNTHS